MQSWYIHIFVAHGSGHFCSRRALLKNVSVYIRKIWSSWLSDLYIIVICIWGMGPRSCRITKWNSNNIVACQRGGVSIKPPDLQAAARHSPLKVPGGVQLLVMDSSKCNIRSRRTWSWSHYWTDCSATHQESIKEQYLVRATVGFFIFGKNYFIF